MSLGRAGVVASDISIILSCFGLITSYLLVVGDALVDPIASVSPMPASDIRVILLVVATVVLIPLGCMRYLNHLRYGRYFCFNFDLGSSVALYSFLRLHAKKRTLFILRPSLDFDALLIPYRFSIIGSF